MKITILGSCRQHSLNKKYDVTSIQESLSYPHYTKEILEVIKYCKYQHISKNDTLKVFRTPILNKQHVNYNFVHFVNQHLHYLKQGEYSFLQ